MPPLVSCVVSAFNGKKYITHALDSIYEQTYKNVEVLVADGGSSDGTREVVQTYDPGIPFLNDGTLEAGATRNLGIRAARGGFIAFLDADDLWHRLKLERQLARFAVRPELDLCLTHVQNFWTSEMRSEEEQLKGHPRAGPIPGYATTTLLARADVFARVGLLDPQLQFADATEWFLRCSEQGVIHELLPDVLVYHRMHPSNLTRRRSGESRKEFLAVVKASLDRRRARGGDASFSWLGDTLRWDPET